MTRFSGFAALPRLGAVLALLFVGACDKEVASNTAHQKEGRPAPELVATTLDGQVVRLEAYRGKAVLINFWLVGCGPCMAEMPEIDAFYRDNRDKGFEVLAVNMGQPNGVIAQSVARLGVSFPMLADPLKITLERYEVVGAPTSFIIDRNGTLVERIDGPLGPSVLEAKLGPVIASRL